MISKNDIKSIKALAVKKLRQEKGLFVAEGHKLVDELLEVFDCTLIVATEGAIFSPKGTTYTITAHQPDAKPTGCTCCIQNSGI